MTIAQITKEHEQQNAIHDAAKRIVELIDETAKAVAKLGGDAEAARERILELVTDE